MSILLGLNTAIRALMTQQQALNTTSHNISNANTPGFSRQQALLETTTPFTVPSQNKAALAQQVGTGVTIREIRRIRDQFLDVQFRQRNETFGFWSAATKELREIENVLSEPSENGLGHQMSQSWNRWRDLANDPRNVAVRLSLREESANLAAVIRDGYTQLTQQRTAIDQRVAIDVDTINSIASQINSLNDQIQKVQAVGDTPNDLLDRRDLLIDDLSKVIKISTIEMDSGAVSVAIGGIQLVGPGYLTKINTVLAVPVPNPLNLGPVRNLQWADGSSVTVNGGEMRALLNMRDTTIPSKLTGLESLADALITAVNTQHRLGFGLAGAADTNLDFFGNLDGTAANVADTNNASKIDIAAAIKAAGGETRIAASATLAGVPGDSANANSIAAKQFALVLSGATATMEEFYRGMIATLGVETQEAQRETENQTLLVRHIQQARESASGVSLDEEATNMIKFQRAYEGAARMVTTLDEMLDTLINRMGIVGR